MKQPSKTIRFFLPLVFLCHFDSNVVSIQAESQRLFPVTIHGKMGYINKSGELIVAATFDRAWPMENGFGIVMASQKLGLIDSKGKVVIEPKFRSDGGLDYPQNGLAVFITEKGAYGFVDANGGEVIAPKFKYVLRFSERLAPAISDGKFGYIDGTGQFVINPAFDDARPFHDGLARVQLGMNFFFIDKKGQRAFEKDLDYAYSFSEGLAAVNRGGKPPGETLREIGGKWGFVNREGKFVIEPLFDDVRVGGFSEGLAGVNIGGRVKGKWGFIDKNGKYIIEPQYEWVGNFSDGYAFVVDHNRKFGFIDKTGKVVIEPQYNAAWNFSGGLAEVGVGSGNDEKFGYIDKKGTFVWRPTK